MIKKKYYIINWEDNKKNVKEFCDVECDDANNNKNENETKNMELNLWNILYFF